MLNIEASGQFDAGEEESFWEEKQEAADGWKILRPKPWPESEPEPERDPNEPDPWPDEPTPTLDIIREADGSWTVFQDDRKLRAGFKSKRAARRWFLEKPERCSRRGKAMVADLAQARWYLKDSADIRNLVRLAQGGDEKAKAELHKRYHPLVLKLAGEFRGTDLKDRPEFQQLIAVGHAGLWQGILNFDLRRNNTLGAYLAPRCDRGKKPKPGPIRSAMLDLVKEWRHRGIRMSQTVPAI
jgi:hypothetical protein